MFPDDIGIFAGVRCLLDVFTVRLLPSILLPFFHHILASCRALLTFSKLCKAAWPSMQRPWKVHKLEVRQS